MYIGVSAVVASLAVILEPFLPSGCCLRASLAGWGLVLTGLLSVMTAAVAAPASPGLLYLTGFETAGSPSFGLGDLQGQGGWDVHSGQAEVVQSGFGGGVQSLRARGADIELGMAYSANVVWVDFVLAGGGSDLQPMLPEGAASAVLLLSPERGILALDGDGEGNGVFLASTQRVSAIGDGPQRVSLRMDYQARRYDLWIDGVLRLAGLGFKDNAISSLESFRWLSGTLGAMDDFSVGLLGLDRDSDIDGLSDLDEVKFHGTRPDQADTDQDGVSDGSEVHDGSDPLVAGEGWRLSIQVVDSLHHRIGFPTVSGRIYFLERRSHLLPSQAWLKVLEVAPTRGDGNARFFTLPNGVDPVFYRVISEP